jgi:hypothetical protein
MVKDYDVVRIKRCQAAARTQIVDDHHEVYSVEKLNLLEPDKWNLMKLLVLNSANSHGCSVSRLARGS